MRISKTEYDNTIQKLISGYGTAQSLYISNLDKNDTTQSEIYLKQMTDINSKMALFSNTYAGKIKTSSVYTETPIYPSIDNISSEVNYYSDGIKTMNEKNTELDAMNESLVLQRSSVSMYITTFLIFVAVVLSLFFIRTNTQNVDTLELFILFLAVIILLFFSRGFLYNIKNKSVDFINKTIIWIKSKLYSDNY